MMPPICTVCGADADVPTGLLYFHEDEPEVHEAGWTGHPRNAGWFCPQHLPAAEKLIHLELPEALRIIRGGA